MKTRAGRPPKSGKDVLDERLEIRVTQGEKVSYEEAAAANGMERSDWIRDALNRAAKKAKRK